MANVVLPLQDCPKTTILSSMLSIVTVNFNSYDWLNILLESLELFTKCPYEIIVVDNSCKPLKLNNLKQIINYENVGHGEGLNQGIKEAAFDFVLFLDVDCHALSHEWEKPFFELAKEYDVIGGKGSPQKPIRPSCMFLKKEIAQKYDWRATPGYRGVRITPEGHDVAIQGFYQMQRDNVSIKLLEPQKSQYNTINGEEWIIDGKRTFYHHWSGTWLQERQMDFAQNLIEDKEKLFSLIPWRLI